MPLAGFPIDKRSALLLDKENMTKYSISPMSSLYELYLRHPRISTDSRRIEPDSVFFALRGASFDGNRFAADALEKGAAYAVVDDPSLPNTRPDKADRLIVVDDALQTLQALAREHRRELGLPILTITGSNGKTTTKELVSRVLAEKYEVYATRGNLNNHIGVPLTLLAMTRDVEFGIVEMGASACGEIALLCSIAEPNYGIVTNIGRAHLEGFGGPEGVRRGKGELYDWLARAGGRAFRSYRQTPLPVSASFVKALHSLRLKRVRAIRLTSLRPELQWQYGRKTNLLPHRASALLPAEY